MYNKDVINNTSALQKEFKNKKILVVGLGIQGGGMGVSKFFAELGAQVTVTDKKTKGQLQSSIDSLKEYPIEYKLGVHNLQDFLDADIIFKGPSVPWDMPEIVAAQRNRIPVEMEASFFVRHCPAMTIGITGTRGKSTTTQMIYEVVKITGKNIFLAGNIPGKSTISLLNEVSADSIVVLELSSWQLSSFHKDKISPNIAVFTNFYPDHLNYYDSMEDYFFDKSAIYQYQKKGDRFIANESLKTHLHTQNVEFFSEQDVSFELTYLKGTHNKENAAAALHIARILGVAEEKAKEIIKNFHGLPFRQQIIGKRENVIFINDTTSTTPTATVKAIETFSDKPIVLILGGNAKRLPFDELKEKLSKVKKIILLKGSFTDEIFPDAPVVFDSLDDALKEANVCAKKYREEVYVLFSPGATSFAMFKNEFDRGEAFNKLVSSTIHS